MLTIRQAAPRDHEAMLRVWLAASRQGHGFLGEDVLAAQAEKVRDVYFHLADHWVAGSDTITGFIALIDRHIGGLFVDPAAHRRAIGRQLVAHAAARLGELSVDVYERNKGALGFYESCGFIITERREQDEEGRDFALLRLHRPASAG